MKNYENAETARSTTGTKQGRQHSSYQAAEEDKIEVRGSLIEKKLSAFPSQDESDSLNQFYFF